VLLRSPKIRKNNVGYSDEGRCLAFDVSISYFTASSSNSQRYFRSVKF